MTKLDGDKEWNCIACVCTLMTHQTSCVWNECISNTLHARNDYCVRNACCAFGGKSIIDDGFNAAAFFGKLFLQRVCNVLGGELRLHVTFYGIPFTSARGSCCCTWCGKDTHY